MSIWSRGRSVENAIIAEGVDIVGRFRPIIASGGQIISEQSVSFKAHGRPNPPLPYPGNCGRYESCFVCGEDDCNWKGDSRGR